MGHELRTNWAGLLLRRKGRMERAAQDALGGPGLPGARGGGPQQGSTVTPSHAPPAPAALRSPLLTLGPVPCSAPVPEQVPPND